MDIATSRGVLNLTFERAPQYPMKVIVDFYDRLYCGLVMAFSKSDKRTDQIASAASSLAIFEAWYWFDLHLAVEIFDGRVSPILLLRLKLIIVFVVLTIGNMVYFSSRHDRFAGRLRGDQQPSVFDLDALAFYAAPIVAFGFLLWLRQPDIGGVGT